ncbi:hypothetical protein NliqN6_2571 [Naganishia liquefaciens]|uniref:Uncharacterized protein n=1 Tax=Naganishia liquefaciens TaxID=104408 RepID=A0A8H3YE79_9TREE|nr:hypothetical protein NliqN6_2571 [Naganishia liquefaciens]
MSQGNQTTSLSGRKGNVTFEMWVEIEGKPLEVFAEEESTDGALEAWIASEEGKTLVEHEFGMVSKQDLGKLGTIEVKFTRGREGQRSGLCLGSGRVDDQLVKPISEKAKKGAALLGSVTRLGDVVPLKDAKWSVAFTPHHEDGFQEFFCLRFRHGPKDLLQAQGHTPLRRVGSPDGPGSSKRKAIDIDDVEEQEDEDQQAEQARKKINTRKIPKETAGQLEELKEKLKALEEIARLKVNIGEFDQRQLLLTDW